MEVNKNLSFNVYNNENFVNSYAKNGKNNAYNAYYERPAMYSLLPEIAGKTVLDAGCGAGYYIQWLLEKGASEIVGLDYSPKMIAWTRQRVVGLDRAAAARVTIFEGNLNEPLTNCKDAHFDVIVCSLVLHYLKDWQAVFGEFYRVLKKDGILVFSTMHPFCDFHNHPNGNYFEVELMKERWDSYNIAVESYRRSLGSILTDLRVANFVLDTLLEAQPTEDCKRLYPKSYEKLSREPAFICLRAKKARTDEQLFFQPK